MGCCTGRCFLLTICFLQLVSIIERMVFDFLGYMWVPIIGDFLQVIFVVIGLISTYQYRSCVLKVYAIWSLLWIAWNAFMICLYLEVGILERDGPILNLGTENKSWWYSNGLGCDPPSETVGDSSTVAVVSDEPVPGCFLQYYYVEVIHAGVQCLLALIGFCVSCFVIHVFSEEDDSSQPVHDELEYIKMRYRSPARRSFRHNKTHYDTLHNTTATSNTTTSTYTSINPHHGEETNSSYRPPENKTKSRDISAGDFEPDLPWSPKVQQQQQQQGSTTEDYGFNSSSIQPLFGAPPGQTII